MDTYISETRPKYMQVDQPTGQVQSEIPNELSNLDRGVNLIISEIRELQKMLEPILSPDAPEVGVEEKMQDRETKIGQSLQHANSGLDTALSYLREIKYRIRL